MNLSSIDLNLLLVLHTVLEEKSVARAAEKLSVTPPAVSNSLARLRSILGDPLFVRRGRSLTPTPRAVELAPQLRTALGALSHALEERFDPAVTRRRFALALADTDLACSAPEIAAEVTKRMPHAELQIVSIDTLEATDGLATGVIDAAMAPAPFFPKEPGLHTAQLYEDEGVLLIRKTHPAAKGRRISREQFNSLRHVDSWLVLGKPSRGHRVAEEFFARQDLKRNVALIVPNFFTAAMVVASSDLTVAIPRRIAERFATMLPLRVLSFANPPLRFEQHLVWHERTHRDPGSAMVRDLVREVTRRPWRPSLPVASRRSRPAPNNA